MLVRASFLMFVFNIHIDSPKTLEAILDRLQELNKTMSELFDKVVELETKVDAEMVQGEAVLVQVSALTELSTALQAEVERLSELLASVPDAAELPAIIEALDRISVKVMGIIPDAPAE